MGGRNAGLTPSKPSPSKGEGHEGMYPLPRQNRTAHPSHRDARPKALYQAAEGLPKELCASRITCSPLTYRDLRHMIPHKSIDVFP
jgi:hypothetical protein